MKVILTEEHIRKGNGSRHGGSCPMYFAISEVLGNHRIHVSSMYVSRANDCEDVCRLPVDAQNWIQSWDDYVSGRSHNKPGPVEFEIEVEARNEEEKARS